MFNILNEYVWICLMDWISVCHVSWVQAMAAPRPFGVALVLLVLAQAKIGQRNAKRCKEGKDIKFIKV